MTSFKVNLSFALLLLISPSIASATPTPLSQTDLHWLQKMVSAARDTDYMGTFVYQSGSYIETSRVTHVLKGNDEYERMEGLDGERSEVIRKNDQLWCYLGENKAMVAKLDGARMFPALLPEQLTLLHDNYLLRHGEEDRVAGFHAHTVSFQPRDKLRYAHKMWAHSDTGLLLKAVVMDEQNNIIEQYVFTQLELGKGIDQKWLPLDKLTASDSPPVSLNAGHKPALRLSHPASGWKVYALPPGFKKITEVNRRLKDKDSRVVHMFYSDGLAGVSVFIEKLNSSSLVDRQGLSSRGAIQMFTKTLDGNLLTVVGEVPPQTVMQVAESVRYGGH